MEYITHSTGYNAKLKKEYERTHTTPDILNGMKLFAIGGNITNDFSTNWDIYANDHGTLYSIARPGTGCKNSYFGDVNHIRHLMRSGYWHDTLTSYGFSLMSK